MSTYNMINAALAYQSRCKLQRNVCRTTLIVILSSTDEPITHLPTKCSWEDEGDELPEMPTWKPLSIPPRPLSLMQVETPTPVLPPMPDPPTIPEFGIWRGEMEPMDWSPSPQIREFQNKWS